MGLRHDIVVHAGVDRLDRDVLAPAASRKNEAAVELVLSDPTEKLEAGHLGIR